MRFRMAEPTMQSWAIDYYTGAIQVVHGVAETDDPYEISLLEARGWLPIFDLEPMPPVVDPDPDPMTALSAADDMSDVASDD